MPEGNIVHGYYVRARSFLERMSWEDKKIKLVSVDSLYRHPPAFSNEDKVPPLHIYYPMALEYTETSLVKRFSSLGPDMLTDWGLSCKGKKLILSLGGATYAISFYLYGIIITDIDIATPTTYKSEKFRGNLFLPREHPYVQNIIVCETRY